MACRQVELHQDPASMIGVDSPSGRQTHFVVDSIGVLLHV